MTAQQSYFVEYNNETYEVYYTSKNGYLIDFIDLENQSKEWVPKIVDKLEAFNVAVIQLELMPWSALGKGLIEEHFNPIYQGMKSELEFMKNSGFDLAFSKVINQATDGFSKDRSKLSKKELKEKYGDAKCEWYQAALEADKFINFTQAELNEVEKYQEELQGYTKSSEAFFEPFQVLKIETENSIKVLPLDNKEGFELFNNKKVAWFKIDTEESFNLAKEVLPLIYKEWVESSKDIFGYDKLEGVVIKPIESNLTNVAPYFKVRNKEYLRLVYGPLYQLEPAYSKILDKKRISRKLKASIEEWNLGLEMLNIPYKELNISNAKAVNLMMKMIGIEKQVSELDPRL